MPKHYKFNYQGETINAKTLAKKLGIPYPGFRKMIKEKNCQTTEDVFNELYKKEKFHIGDKYGRYTIISDEFEIHNTHILVNVRCECGKETKKLLSDLKTGNIKGCRNCMARERSRNVQIGDVYKNWKVIEGPRVSKSGCIEYKVLCLKCNKTTRWIQPNELMNPNMCFMCCKCAAIKRGLESRHVKGYTADFVITQYNKIKKICWKKKNWFFS